MDKPWIKILLIVAFIVALLFVFVGAYDALKPQTYTAFELPPTPSAPPPLIIPKIEDFSKPELVDKQLALLKLQVQLYTDAGVAYKANVTAYATEIEARTTAWKAKNGDPSARLTAYEKIVKDTIGFYIVNPLLAALLIYSGIKISADVALAKAEKDSVKSP